MTNREQPVWRPAGSIEFESTACPVCGGEAASPRYTKKIRNDTMTYYVCPRCQALFANPRATVESLRRIYGSADFFKGGEAGGQHLNYFDFVAGEEFLRMTARDRLSRIKPYTPSGRMLEVASAAGFFLVEAKNAGYNISGIEFSAPMAEYASRRWGVPVLPESVELVDLPAQEYDVIASWGVMTIIRDPVALVRKFHRALKPGGIWAFNTYYHDGWWPRLVKSRWNILVVNFSQIYTRQLLLDLVSKEGFRLLSRRREMPYTDLMKLADQLAWNFSAPWMPRLARKMGVSNLIIKIPLPDVLEYVWQKV